MFLHFILTTLIMLVYAYLRINYLDKHGILDNREIALNYLDNIHEFRNIYNVVSLLVFWVISVVIYTCYYEKGAEEGYLLALIQSIAGIEFYLYSLLLNYYRKGEIQYVWINIILALAAAMFISTLTIYNTYFIISVFLVILLKTAEIINVNYPFILMKKFIALKNRSNK